MCKKVFRMSRAIFGAAVLCPFKPVSGREEISERHSRERASASTKRASQYFFPKGEEWDSPGQSPGSTELVL
jgi:hypothetical protein